MAVVVLQGIMTKVALAGALAALLAYLVLRFGPCAARFADAALRRYAALPFLGKVLLPVLFGVAFVFGGSKTNGVVQLNLLFSPRTVSSADIARGWQVWEVRTNETGFAMPANAVRNEDWFRFGGHSMFDFVRFGEDWAFPYGTQELSRVTAMEDGGLRVKLSRTEDEIRTVPCPLAAFPRRSQFWHTTNGAERVFAWQGFFAGGDTGAVVSASVELRANGDFVTRSNAVETLCRRIEPFDYDGDGLPNGSDARPFFYDGDCYGQSEAWVRANFTNAEEILSVGYPAWVDAQVGVGLENGLYKLTATFPEAPRRTTLLSVGDLSVVVTNAGEYVFLLEKGVDYAFGTAPFEPSATYRAEDDLPRRRLLGAAEDDFLAFGEWTIDGGRLTLVSPTAGRFGFCQWLPVFRGVPSVGHLGPGDSPKEFSALLSDYAYADAVRYHWRSTDTNIVIRAPDARETEIAVTNMPLWRSATVSVTASFGTNVLESVCLFSYGEHERPEARVDIDAPQVVLLNDGDGEDRKIARATVSFSSDIETNGTLTLRCSAGGSRIRLAPVDGDSLSWPVFGGETFEFDIEGIATSAAAADIELEAVFVPDCEADPVGDFAPLTVAEVGNVTLPGAPNDGLVVLLGTSVVFDMDVTPVGAKNLLPTIYQVRRLRGDGGYSEWEYAAGSYSGTEAIYNPSAGGIYQVRAMVGRIVGEERCYVWEDYSDYIYGIKVPDDLKAFGVCDEQWQITLRNCARNYLGDLSYGYRSAVEAYGGFSAVGRNSWKCNIFVAHRLAECHLPVPSVHHGRYGIKDWPPLANEWGDESFEIPHWAVLDQMTCPQPGLVVIKPSSGPNGHMGIMDFDGMAISAQEREVTRASNVTKWGSAVYRLYKED